MHDANFSSRGRSMRARVGTVLGLAMVLVACAKSGGDQQAHSFTLATPTGQNVTVDPTVDKRSKVLIFWASW